MQTNVNKDGRHTWLAGETLTDGDTAGYTGRCVCVSTAADDTALLPAAGTDIPCAVLVVGGASAEQVEVETLTPGKEYMVRAGGTISRGARCEIKLTTSDFGKVIAIASGTARFIARRSAVAGDLFKALCIA
jgi:hypothetical protein